MSVLIPVYPHAVCHERIEPYDFASTISYHLRVGVAPEEQVRHHGLPEDERGHLGIWLVMQKEIQRMVDGLFLASFLCVFVQVKRQRCDRLREDTHAGIHSRDLHGRSFIDCLTRRCPAEVVAVTRAVCRVGRLITASEHLRKDTHGHTSIWFKTSRITKKPSRERTIILSPHRNKMPRLS